MLFDQLGEILRVLLALAMVERGRLTQGPGPLVTDLRTIGRRQRERTPAQRLQLQAVIARVDAHMPDGGNCYRRVLLEIGLDRGAAAEPLSMGLSGSGAPLSGHAWLGAAAADACKSYDATIAL
jgi:hypothetical protein